MASFNLVYYPQSPAFVVLMAMSLIGFASSDYASDRAECADQVMALSTCLTYMQGSARAPTPDCCSSLKQVVEKSFKCVCVLVKDRNEPELASFKVNVTLALGLPSRCHVPANASDCPRLLNLPLNSTDAKVFEQYGNALKGNSASDSGNSNGNASMSTKAGGWRIETGAGLWNLSLLLLVPLLILGS